MKNLSSKTIKLFLIDGEPTGSKKVQLSNWSGITFVIPRNKLELINKRDEFTKQCLYFLIGGTSISPEIYVGEAENFRNRIVAHQNRDFWNMCIVFLAKDENLSKAHIKFLEAKFIEDCKTANRAKMHNSNSPDGSKLSEEDESEMIEFKQNIKLILSTLGFTFHEIESEDGAKHEKYYIKAKGLEAKGIYTSEGMIILEGSQVSKEEVGSIQKFLHILRDEKIKEQAIVDKGNHYEVVQKITFSSLSTASGFILGRSSNGWCEWKNAEGKTIDSTVRKVL